MQSRYAPTEISLISKAHTLDIVTATRTAKSRERSSRQRPLKQDRYNRKIDPTTWPLTSWGRRANASPDGLALRMHLIDVGAVRVNIAMICQLNDGVP